MAKVEPKRYDLAEVIREELQKTKPVIITAGTETFEIPPPVLWPDAAFEVSDVESARLILGADQYEAFVKAGGTAALLFAIVKKANGADLGE